MVVSSKPSLSADGKAPIRGLFVDGKEDVSVDRETLPILSPRDGSVIAYTTHANAEDVDTVVASARRAFADPEWASMPVRTRSLLIYKLADAIEKNIGDLFELESINNGRPMRETKAQVGKLADMYRYNASLAMAKRDAVIPVEGAYHAYTLRQPVGVVANVSPFNHPLLIASRNIAPTLASGCTTVLKPSEYTPLTAIRLWEIFRDAGLPPGVFNLVTGLGATTGKALTAHRGINKLALTGGVESGRAAGMAAISNFSPVTLELGGKAPVLVFDDFDLDRAVDYAAFGAFIGAGQTCVCASRHLVQRTIYDEFVARLAAKAKTIRVGDPFDAKTQMGPLASPQQLKRVLSYIDIAKEEGARLVAGGGVPEHLKDTGGFYVEPTVFVDVSPDMRIAREEVFGPVTTVIPFDTEDEALAIANDCQFGLAASVRTSNVARAHRLAAKLEAGVVWVNDHHRADIAFPWGGIKDSGIGREGGQESFDAYFYTKAVMVNHSDEHFDWFEPEMRDLRMN